MAGDARPFSEAYLSEVVATQGKFFESLQDDYPTSDAADLMEAYLRSSTRRQLDEGHAYYLTLDAVRLRDLFLEESGYVPRPGRPLCGFLPNWLGRFYAYSQWHWNVSSALLVERLPVADLAALYPGAHDLDLALAVQKIGAPLF